MAGGSDAGPLPFDTHKIDLETLARVVAVLRMTAGQALAIRVLDYADLDGPLRRRANIDMLDLSDATLAGAFGVLESPVHTE